MKKIFVVTTMFFFTFSLSGQSDKKDILSNLDFEKIEKGNPSGWLLSDDAAYLITHDSTHSKSGKYSASIRFTGKNAGYKTLSVILPQAYDGKKITLSGYIKTENVSDGYAGLWMRIDPSIAFENMSSQGITGTTDWKKYEITLDMNPKMTEKIEIGGVLVGKGQIWLDDFEVTIDGKQITEAGIYENKDKVYETRSMIGPLSINNIQKENLKVLCMVWGFLKYYHPSVANGDYNWDFELFKILPKIIDSKNPSERDAALTEWIKKMGQFPVLKEFPEIREEIKMKPDLSWIHSSGLSEDLIDLLLKVQSAERLGYNFYVSLVPGVGNPDFARENAYGGMKYPDTGYRLLALFRYWNIIEYYFPYKNLIGEDWKGLLPEFIPRITEAKNEKEYTITMLELVGRIHDTHANLYDSHKILDSLFGLRYGGAELTFVENKVVVTGFYNESVEKETGLKTGDIITKINGVTIKDIIKKHLKQTPASNYPTQLRDIARDLLRTNDSTITIEYVRDKQKVRNRIRSYDSQSFDIYRRFFPQDTCFKVLSPGIAYINNGTVKKADFPWIWDRIEHMEGVIIDARNYPSDFVIHELSNYLMPDRTPFVKFTNGSLKTPGLFTFTAPLEAGHTNKSYYKGKVIILINEISQSSAEFHTMSYRVAPKAIVIGSTTAGADGNVSSFSLPGGLRTAISGIGVYYPDGRETQRIGIIPDIVIQPTIKSIRKGQDLVLEKALEIIKKP